LIEFFAQYLKNEFHDVKMSVSVKWDESDSEFLSATLHFECKEPVGGFQFELIDESIEGYKKILTALQTGICATYNFANPDGGFDISVKDKEIVFEIFTWCGKTKIFFDGKLFEPAFTELVDRFTAWNLSSALNFLVIPFQRNPFVYMFPLEIYYHILCNCDGFERENMKPMCRAFSEFKFDIKTDNPARDREVSLLQDKDFRYLFEYGHEDLIKIYLVSHKSKRGIDALIYASQFGLYSLFDYLMTSGRRRRSNTGMLAACVGGNIDIVKKMIERGANNWNEGLIKACGSAHPSIVILMLDSGATHLDDALRCTWRCHNPLCKHQDIIKILMCRGAKHGTFTRCRGNYGELICSDKN
jgi:hypothetical protein